MISSVPDINGYSSYTYKICDTLSDGLTYDTGSVKVKIDDSTDLANTYYTVNASGQNIEITFKIKDAIDANVISQGKKLYTYYTATLNTSAKVAGPAADTTNYNENTAYLEYSNNPYDTTVGKTPESKVYDWTYKYTIKKVDKNGNPLSGAGFTITAGGTALKFTQQAGTTNYVVDPNGTITEIKTDATGSFAILGLDDNIKYTLEETTVPKGYSKCDDVDLTFASTYNTTGNELLTLTATVNNAKSHDDSTATIENISG